MVPFSQLPAVKNDTIFGAARNFLDPSYFVTALESMVYDTTNNVPILETLHRIRIF
jgi:hypothetical protein